MPRASHTLLLLFLLLPVVLATQTNLITTIVHEHDDALTSHPTHTNSNRQLQFISNEGQWESQISYAADLGGLNRLYLEKNRFTFWLFDQDQSIDLHDKMLAYPGKEDVFDLSGHAYQVNFLGSQATHFSVAETQKNRRNYLLGDDQSRWAKNVSSHNEVIYEELYPGIQLVASSEGGNFKYDFVVRPQAEATTITLEYTSIDSLYLDQGDLILLTKVGPIRELKPYAFQRIDGKEIEIPCQYLLQGNLISFAFPEGYNADYPLTIDPTVVGATLAGSDVNRAFGHSATFDNGGNIYTAGISFGMGYPTTFGAFSEMFMGGLVDVVISKFNPEGSLLLYSTYIGGSDREHPYSTVVDDNGQLSFLGSTLSRNYPTTDNAFQDNYRGGSDIIVTKLSADGSTLVGSTFLGGTGADGLNNSPFNSIGGDVYRGEIVLDANGNIYIATASQSDDFPVTSNAFQQEINEGGNFGFAQDGVLCKLNSDLSTLFWSTYLGGGAIDHCSSLRVDDENNVYVSGFAGAPDFPMVPGGMQDVWSGGNESAFIARMSADGSEMLNGTFWGTRSEDRSYFLDIDEENQVHIFGITKGDMLITQDTWFANRGSNQFVAAFSEDLSTLIYSTVIGAPTDFNNANNFIPVAFMVDKCNGIYLSGYYSTDGLPLTGDFVNNQSNSFYLAVLEPNATGLIFGSYYGDANHVDGGTSRFDKGGVVYQGVCSCVFDNRILNVTSNAWETFQNTDCDVGVFKIDFDVEVVTAAGIASPATSGCLPLTIDFNYSGQDAETVSWDFGNGDTSAGRDISYTFTEAGNYTVTQIAQSPNSCNLSDTFRLQVVVLDGNSTRTDLSFCAGEDITFLDASVPGASYSWQDGTTAATYQPEDNGTYWVEITVDECTRRDSFVLSPPTPMTVDLGEDQLILCDQTSFEFNVEDPEATSFRWQDSSQDATLTATTSGVYSVTLTDAFGCQVSDEIEVHFNESVSVSLGPDLTLCDGDTATLDASAIGVSYRWLDTSDQPFYPVTEPGLYWVELNNDGCLSRDSIQAIFNPQPNTTIKASPSVCFNENNGFIVLTEIGGGTDFTYRWSSGEIVPDRIDLGDGVYSLTITNEFGCTNSYSQVISRDTEIIFDATVIANPCTPDDGGVVMATGVDGGQPPYLYALGDDAFGEMPSFAGLRGGIFLITVQDATGCIASRPVTLIEPPTIILDAGSDRLIDFADSTLLTGSISFAENMVFSWAPDVEISAPRQLRTFARPLAGKTNFLLTAIDTITGCRYVDSVTIRVDQLRKVYLPSAFSPNGDGINDLFYPQSDHAVERVNYLRIYDRWGGVVFERNDFTTNDPNFGWDGTDTGDRLGEQVFVYITEVVFAGGQTRVYRGDVMLLR